MSGSRTIPVRLSEPVIQRIGQAAETLGMQHRSDVVKLCISAFLDAFEHDGKASLPLDWREVLRSGDGRTTRYTAKNRRMRADQVAAFGGKIDNRMVAEKRADYGANRRRKQK